MAKEVYTVASNKAGLHNIIRQCGEPEEVFETYDSLENAMLRAAELNSDAEQASAALVRLPLFLRP